MNQDDKLRRLRSFVASQGWWYSAFIEDKIDRLLAEDEPETPSETPDDEVLLDYLRSSEKVLTLHYGDTITPMLRELCRRALENP